MPSVSKKQQMFMAIELEKKRKGQKTKTGMSAQQLEDFAATPRKGLPTKVKSKKKR